MNISTMVTHAAGAVANARAEPWSTKPSECDESTVPSSHWYLSVFCPNCIAAKSKANMDQSNTWFNFLCLPPPVSYSYVRLGYNLEGSWKSDCVNGCLCWPCGVRQVYTESTKRGTIAGKYGQLSQQWSSQLTQCDDLQEVAKAIFCPCAVSHLIRSMIQPGAHPAFDYFCLPPTAMYGIVRNTYGIGSEWPHPAMEDVFVGLFFYPCALNRALREATYQKTVNATNAVAGVIGSAQAKVQQLGAKALYSVGQLGKGNSAPPAPGRMA